MRPEALLPRNLPSAQVGLISRFSEFLRPTVSYLLHLDSHVYALSIAAAVLLGFFPFLVLILSLSQNVLRWPGAADAIYIGLRDLLPNDPGLVEFVIRNLRAAVATRGRVEALSVVALLFSSNGIFMPLEVAMNRLWGFPADRSYWLNQLLSLAMTFACGLLALSAAVLTANHAGALRQTLGLPPYLSDWVTLITLKSISLPITVLILLIIYWLLPNGRVRFLQVLPWAAVTAVGLEAGRAAYTWAWGYMDFRSAYGPFFISITILLWGFFAAMIILAGAEIASRPARRRKVAEPPSGAPERKTPPREEQESPETPPAAPRGESSA